MKKTLVVGDTHIKFSFLKDKLDKIKEEENIERVILLGDYTDDWQASKQLFLKNMEDIVKWKQNFKIETVFICGNHDLQYLFENGQPYSYISKEVVSTYLDELELVAAYYDDGFLFSHAGLTNSWKDLHLSGVKIENLAEEMNNIFKNNCEYYNSAGTARGGNQIPSPMWADFRELIRDPLKGVKQVVGHSPMVHVEDYNGELYFCDTFSTETSGRPIGDGSMIIFHEGGYKIVKFENYGLDKYSYSQLLDYYCEYGNLY